MSKPTIFDILKQISEKTDNFKYSRKIASGYKLTDWFSHDRYLKDTVHEINKLQFESGMPDEMVYKYYYHAIPKRRRFIKWIKRDPVDKKRQREIKAIAERRNVSLREAEYIHSLLERINNNGNDIPF